MEMKHLIQGRKPEVLLSGFGPWLIAGTPIGEPYLCRCHESRYGKCSPLWCPCSGRPDPQGPQCCAVHNTPARWKEANTAYEMKRAADLGR